jgi:hypothetical protein
MAGEELKDVSELLAAFPDNTAGLIEAVDSRDFIVSMTTGVAFAEDLPADVPYVMPMTAGVPVPFLSAYPAVPGFEGVFWKLDGNNEFVPAYTDVGIFVPAGTLRLNEGTVVLNCQKLGGGTADFTFQGTVGGVFVGEPLTRTIGTVPQVLVFQSVSRYDVSVADPLDFSITPVGHSDDLQINDFRVSLVSVML